MLQNFIIKQQIGKGRFGIVYRAIDKKTNEQVAIKVEQVNSTGQLFNEINILEELQGEDGFPKLKDYGQNKRFCFMIIELLGKNLETIHKTGKISLQNCSLLACQMLDRIRSMHKHEILHRDIKPANFVMGRNNSEKVYIIDFGISKKFDNLSAINHRPNTKHGLIGTHAYASVTAIKGLELSKRDDLESMIYVLVQLVGGQLPWKVGEKKMIGRVLRQGSISAQQICKGLPAQFAMALSYVQSLDFYDFPDYSFIKGLFREINMQEGTSLKSNTVVEPFQQKRPHLTPMIGRRRVARSIDVRRSNLKTPGSSSITRLQMAGLKSNACIIF